MVDNAPCRVQQLGLEATALRSQRGDAELLIPNQTLFQSKAELFTIGNTKDEN